MVKQLHILIFSILIFFCRFSYSEQNQNDQDPFLIEKAPPDVKIITIKRVEKLRNQDQLNITTGIKHHFFWMGTSFSIDLGTNRQSYYINPQLLFNFRWKNFGIGTKVGYLLLQDLYPSRDPVYHSMNFEGNIFYIIRPAALPQQWGIITEFGLGYVIKNAPFLSFALGACYNYGNMEIRVFFTKPNIWFFEDFVLLNIEFAVSILFGII